MHDPRKKDQCRYTLEQLLWLALLMFIFRLRSRRQLLAESGTACFLSNLLDLSGTLEEFVAHPDTMNYSMERLHPCETEKLKVKMVKKLIVNRRLDAFRLFGLYMVAVDAAGLFSFSSRHCEHCLEAKNSNGTTTFSHKILEAKLVTEKGLAFSICSEPIENENGCYEKQDCELKAFYRMEKRLKRQFPRTKLCLLMDGLYACSELFAICRRNGWEYIVVFKEGRIPTLYAEAERMIKKLPENSLVSPSENGVEQRFAWVNGLRYGGDYVHAVFCDDVAADGEITRWRWLSSMRANKGNVEEICNKGGRQRWKIENQGFNDQKRQEYELEHLYGETPNAWKNYYQLLQIAHMIVQLMTHGDLCAKQQRLASGDPRRTPLSFLGYYKSVRNFIRRLRESFRNACFSRGCSEIAGKIQIRLDTG